MEQETSSIKENEIRYEDLDSPPGRRLGSGNFGRIFEGRYKNRPVAYKIMKHAIHSSIFFNEISILKSLDHECICSLYGYVRHENLMILVLEKIHGISLYHYLLYQEMDLSRKQQLGKQVLSTMVYLHNQLVLYGDLKPENIMIHPETMRHKIVDFGLSQRLESPISKVKGMVGTPGYMAPEIIQEEEYGLKVDVFAYGMVLYVLFSEQPPASPTTREYYLRSRSFRPYRKLIRWCTSEEAEYRPSFLELSMIYDQVLSQQTTDTGWWSCLLSFFFCSSV